MSFGIIVRNKSRGTVSRENKTEFRNEKRIKELSRRGYDIDNIRAMVKAKNNGIEEHHVEKILKHSVNPKEMTMDGKL